MTLKPGNERYGTVILSLHLSKYEDGGIIRHITTLLYGAILQALHVFSCQTIVKDYSILYYIYGQLT